MQTQMDLFSRLENPQIEAAVPQDSELDEAIDTLALTFLPFIIRALMSYEAADLLRRQRDNPVLNKDNAGQWQRPLVELLKHRLVFYESRKPILIGIHRKRVLEMAAETDKRIDAWKAGEIGSEERAMA